MAEAKQDACGQCGCDKGGKEVEDLVPDVHFEYQAMFQHANPVDVPYTKMDGMSAGIAVEEIKVSSGSKKIVTVQPWVLRELSKHCISDQPFSSTGAPCAAGKDSDGSRGVRERPLHRPQFASECSESFWRAASWLPGHWDSHRYGQARHARVHRR